MKVKVIELWYKGKTYRQISEQTGVSTGKISEIINTHMEQLGEHQAESIRQLVLTINQAGLSPKECATGVRIRNMLSELKVDDDEELQSFLQGIFNEYSNYNNSIKVETEEGSSSQEQLLLTPSKLFSLTKELFRISKSEGGAGGVPLSQVPQYVKNRLDEKKELENTLEDLRKQIAAAKEESKAALEEKEVISANLSQYVYVRDELAGKYGLQVTDISALASAINNSKRLGHDATAIAATISRIDSLESKEKGLFNRCNELSERMGTLDKGCQRYRQQLDSLKLTKKEYDDLKAMGFGLNELKLLRNTLKELAKTDAASAIRKFFRDLEEMYPKKLDLEGKIAALRQEVKNYENLTEEAQRRYSDYKVLSETINLLLNTKGFRQDDILYLESVITKYNIGRKSKDKFAADLEKYGDIEQAIAASSVHLKQLRKEMQQLEVRKAKLAESVDSLLAKRDAISEALDYDAKLAKATIAETQVEAGQSIAELTGKATEGFKISRELLEESQKVSNESTAIVSKLRVEVGEQFAAISRLQGFRDLAQIISDIYSEQDSSKLQTDTDKYHRLLVQTVRIISMLQGAYDRLGKTATIEPIITHNSILMYTLISLGPKAASGSPSLHQNTSTTEAKQGQAEEKLRDEGR